ncbi:coiled-coil-helix-coiled-coil-helix domain containing 6 (predicted), isoform CRA_b [Rattus norvegicus]|uniref:Coiled-coil-helix-coiled-coil-helix domain containing 6 (Predicted), isoform CRA_b n=1 Tax=Rattus norvegicus TaxID=10116 RepID=A6IB61_RAT|nr:coiled-coil-helix-coiled-coil-helix domain containing 6 (predicted), isoform CRA_b [Rattus norvegicus]EDL91331.1 coiled-coil-helix-coiled-coil-helix domain containing 6 (predicted), isoform CRA_b [Rattus norvegicus]
MLRPGQGIPALCEHRPQGLRSSILPGALKKGPIMRPQTMVPMPCSL